MIILTHYGTPRPQLVNPDHIVDVYVVWDKVKKRNSTKIITSVVSTNVKVVELNGEKTEIVVNEPMILNVNEDLPLIMEKIDDFHGYDKRDYSHISSPKTIQEKIKRDCEFVVRHV